MSQTNEAMHEKRRKVVVSFTFKIHCKSNTVSEFPNVLVADESTAENFGKLFEEFIQV